MHGHLFSFKSDKHVHLAYSLSIWFLERFLGFLAFVDLSLFLLSVCLFLVNVLIVCVFLSVCLIFYFSDLELLLVLYVVDLFASLCRLVFLFNIVNVHLCRLIIVFMWE